MTHPIKLVKLINGDSLLTQINVNTGEEYVTLISPMKIHKWMQQDDEGSAYENATFGPWESFSSDQEFHVAKSSIVILTNPREDVIRYYHRLLEKVKTVPIESFDDDDDIAEDFSNLRRVKEALNEITSQLGIADDEAEEVMDYLDNKDNLIKH
jgi:hypothetical protein